MMQTTRPTQCRDWCDQCDPYWNRECLEPGTIRTAERRAVPPTDRSIASSCRSPWCRKPRRYLYLFTLVGTKLVDYLGWSTLPGLRQASILVAGSIRDQLLASPLRTDPSRPPYRLAGF